MTTRGLEQETAFSPGHRSFGLAGFRRLVGTLEAEAARLFLWLPVVFGAGILTYFSLSQEPGIWLASLLTLLGASLLIALRRAPLGAAIGIALLGFALGFATAKLRTELVRAPVLERELAFVAVTGWIEGIEQRPNGRSRLTVRLVSLDRLPQDETPYRITATTGREAASGFATGEAVRFRATLMPPPAPARPGGFDFSRKAWFERIGGTGYAVSRVEKIALQTPLPLTIRLWAAIDRVRNAINARIAAALPGEEGGLAIALITGDRGGVPDEVQQAMRDSGLAHILAISGLHMMLMAGTVFWAARALLATIPSLALRFPIRKWAAGSALIAALAYLAISGAAVPTVRAWIMMSIVLLAVLLDRPAITMRNVALAALAILAVAPESIFQPSFQMSFAAVVALVAIYETLSARRAAKAGTDLPDVSPLWRHFRFATLLIAGAALTTIVAGLATSPFAAFHFHRIAYYGLAANLLATPLISLLVMPMALLALIAMPFGLEALPLAAMGFGLELMVSIGKTVSAWPGAVDRVPAISGVSLALIAIGALWLCLWTRTWRLLGLAAIAGGLLLGTMAARPDLLIERDGEAIAVRSANGELALSPGSERNYSAQKWLEADGDDRNPAFAAANGAFACDSLGCMTEAAGLRVAYLNHLAAAEEDCARATIVIAALYLPPACRTPRLVIDKGRLRREGAMAVYLSDDREGGLRVETVADAQGDRPWSHYARIKDKKR